jgi:energy-coupling factor transporter ATP-binding protein EcfA2
LLVSEEIRGVDTSLKDIKTLEQSKAIIEWLRAPDPSVNHNRAYEKHGAGTGQWLYSDTQFLRWKLSSNDFIWLFGPPGCGKTVFSSTIIEYLIKHDSGPIIFFYFDFNDQNKQHFENMIRSFLAQLYNKSPVAQSLIQSLHTSHAGGSQQPSITRLENTLTAILEQVGGCKVVIDALDESKTCDRVLTWCKNMNAFQTLDVRLLVTSQTYVVDWHDAEQIMHITTENVSDWTRDVSWRLPAWSKDSWSFLPRKLSISHDTEMLLTNDARRRSVILQTTALRASLLCRPQAYPSNSSL